MTPTDQARCPTKPELSVLDFALEAVPDNVDDIDKAEGKKGQMDPRYARAIFLNKKLMEMQFNSEIEEFARYLNDKEYQNEINEQYEKECKVNEL